MSAKADSPGYGVVDPISGLRRLPLSIVIIDVAGFGR
jgi:hypothetical protein